MNKTIDIRQVEFVLVIENHSPATLNLDFLKDEGVVPADWQLAQPPTHTENMVLVPFQNGIYLLHQGNIVAFMEDARTKPLETLEVPHLMHRYLERFAQANYQAVGLNLEGHATFDTQEQARNHLIKTTLVDSQHESDQKMVQGVLNFIYKLNQGTLTLTVKNTALTRSEDDSVPVLLFAANFHRNLSGTNEERVQAASQVTKHWRNDVETYRKIADKQFLKKIEQHAF